MVGVQAGTAGTSEAWEWLGWVEGRVSDPQQPPQTFVNFVKHCSTLSYPSSLSVQVGTQHILANFTLLKTHVHRTVTARRSCWATGSALLKVHSARTTHCTRHAPKGTVVSSIKLLIKTLLHFKRCTLPEGHGHGPPKPPPPPPTGTVRVKLPEKHISRAPVFWCCGCHIH